MASHCRYHHWRRHWDLCDLVLCPVYLLSNPSEKADTIPGQASGSGAVQRISIDSDSSSLWISQVCAVGCEQATANQRRCATTDAKLGIYKPKTSTRRPVRAGCGVRKTRTGAFAGESNARSAGPHSDRRPEPDQGISVWAKSLRWSDTRSQYAWRIHTSSACSGCAATRSKSVSTLTAGSEPLRSADAFSKSL